MKNPEVQKAVNELCTLINQINDLNQYFFKEHLHYTIATKGGTTEPIKFEISYMNQSVKYDY